MKKADGALQGAAGKGIKALHGQIMGVVSTQMWGEFDGAGMYVGVLSIFLICGRHTTIYILYSVYTYGGIVPKTAPGRQ